MPIFYRNDTMLFYEVTGEGHPLIFTHGASWDHKQWINQINFFKKDYKVVSWDVRGHGGSSLPKGPINPEDFILDLLALMDHLSIKKAILCGLSMGGHISLRTAIETPDRVDGLILIGTPCSNALSLNQKLFIQINSLSSRFLPMKTNAFILAKMLSKQNPSTFEYVYNTFSKMPKENWHRIWSAVTRMESKDELHKVKCPTLLLIGDHDIITNFQQPILHTKIPGAKLRIIPNAHHCTNLDNPNAVNQFTLEFIDSLKV